MTVTPSSRPENINGRSERRGDERAMYWRGMVSVETLLNLISLQIAGESMSNWIFTEIGSQW